ncbi:MAG: hypothetical protein KAH21_12235, partial [Spirochaetaceae bacterium]|nr:hypothetical protein [Spirochaetaceae bacterium]
MKDSRSSRILTILAAVLIIVALLVSIALIILRVPDNRKFDEALLSSEIALKYGKSKQFKNELLKASRLALSEKQWSSILRIAAEGIPSKAAAEDYKLFTVLAGRAASRLPGLQKISAYWIWGLLRSGNLEKAGKHIGLLNENSWPSLIAEVKLKSAVGDSDDDVLAFVEKLGKKSDPEFLSSAAQLTGSAELTFDAAL